MGALSTAGTGEAWARSTDDSGAERRYRYLARASDILGSSLDYDQTLAELARLLVPTSPTGAPSI